MLGNVTVTVVTARGNFAPIARVNARSSRRKLQARFFVVYCLAQRSFQEVPYWLERLRACALHDCAVFVVGNKCDVDAATWQVRSQGRLFCLLSR